MRARTPANSGLFANEPGNLCLRKTAWWAREDSNLQPSGYEPLALTIELRARAFVCTSEGKASGYYTIDREKVIASDAKQ